MLEIFKAQVFDIGVEHRCQIIVNIARDHDFTGASNGLLQSRGKVYGIAQCLVFTDKNLAYMDCRAQQKMPLRR